MKQTLCLGLLFLFTLLPSCKVDQEPEASDEARFSKNILTQGEFTEPTEMTILPNHDVLIAQRRGELLRYAHKNQELKQIAFLPVYYKTDVPEVNAEEGFMGLQKDPNFSTNNWIYCFYSPAGDKWVNRLSRFTYKDGIFDMDSEQIILDISSQRDICCHTGGSIAFGPDNLLYLSTGDNTTPFDKKDAPYVHNGYAPINDLPGDEQYDARRASGNTNDLRGKILRIKVNPDGSYDIPEGNLFPPGMEKTRPEIYVMGLRNPYRISVDSKNGNLFWGDVGPDAADNKWDTRGPMGYDELNVATQAGNYGWPFFVANNKAYFDYDYSNGQSGVQFDANKPINDSRNNTGITELPEAQPAFIYYPYGESEDFEGMESGARNAMAGPMYYVDNFNGPFVLPDYYDGKLIVYDWMRGWMKLVNISPDGVLLGYEPFAPNVVLNSLIDMELGPDGRIYLLEYGNGWFKKNKDSGLSILQYNTGNQAPVISSFRLDQYSGQAPLVVQAQVSTPRPEKNNTTYEWYFGDSMIHGFDSTMHFSFEHEGEYPVHARLIDTEGNISESEIHTVYVGNTRPLVDIEVNEDLFFEPGIPVSYKVHIIDPEDGKNLNTHNIHVSVDYMNGHDEASLSLGHQEEAIISKGQMLVETMDCKACHKATEKSIGPNYTEIALKHKDLNDPIIYLKGKILSGGSGVWGAVPMAAHPNLTNDELTAMAAYIQSLAGQSKKPSLPLEGQIIPPDNSNQSLLIITASYTDKGSHTLPPLTGISKRTLKRRTN